MTTSASVDFSVSRDNLIEDALRAAGALGVEDSASTNQKTHAARVLNMIVKAWGSSGPALWARKRGYILPVSGTNEIVLGSGGGHATLSYTQTTLSAAAASGATSIIVTSATGFGASYYVGVELDNGNITWTTQSGAASGTTVTLAGGLDSAAASGNYVYVYQTKLQRPLRIVDAFVSNLSSNNDNGIDIIPLADYNALSSKTEEGTPNCISYDPQMDTGTARIWPRFENGKTIITIYFQRPFEDFDAAGDTPDFPQEWFFAIFYALAVALAPTYGLPVQDRNLLRGEAKAAYDMAIGNEPEEGSFRFGPRYD